jgi:hypothetical protein
MDFTFKYNIQGRLNQLNAKILLAPFLAVVLVLFLAGAVNSLMLPSGGDTHVQPSYGSTPLPMPAASVSVSYSPFLFIAGAVVVGIAAVLVFFREKNLSEMLSE